ncbi:MAG: 50S ribosomal protein L30 [Gammaproteobacteria bacterium]|jgi:large subunit ribosomal protein L30|nr:50S ribosomal protein L30 [Gammaproteobacteria bacterium]MCH2350021.1 50S ribosomal protein L30 [Pseudomonadales bacterium]MCH2668159.1 50S ribosomal protein L30 [Deinococcales bacterium]HAO55164.1 50S ribosomal protein L30 [Gammaproteobacteria bacterium]
MSKTVRIKLIKSPISKLKKHQACIRGLGLRRVGHEVELEDTPAIRGMISKVNYMLEVEG